ncbi:MAG TPA: glycosyltransferase family 2 protein, partial [Saprospiraceae bacterium]|nr:glycosyltransferase family 2 protein [Saprospiraceae bacterium]
TCALLDSIRRQDYRDVEVFVVDNASRDNPAARIAAQYPEVHFLRSEKNLGFAGGNNLALSQAHGDYLLFINNDAELPSGCLASLLRFLEQHPQVGIVSPLICYYRQAGQPQQPAADLIQYAGMPQVHPCTGRSQMLGNGESDQGQYAQPAPTGYAHGAAMLIRREVLEQVGPMEEAFFLYYEEVDWSERIRQAGWEVWIEPRAKVYHKESASMQDAGSLKTYYLSRNRVWFMRRHYGGWRLAVFYAFLLLVTVPKHAISYLLKGQRENLAAFLDGVWWNFKAPSTGRV